MFHNHYKSIHNDELQSAVICGRGSLGTRPVWCNVSNIVNKMASIVEERLKERDEARKAALELRRQEKAKDNPKEETQGHFSSQFTERIKHIEGMHNQVW